jgi:hypothetical protein
MDLELNPVFARRRPEKEAPDLKRGIPSRILLEHIRNTIPFVFEANPVTPYLKIVREAEVEVARHPKWEPDYVGYFRLCVAAHHTTVCSFVPTDVDNQIRSRLWHPALPTRDLEAMATFVLESRTWDFSPVSNRYASLRSRSPELSRAVMEAILDEVERQAAICRTFAEAQDGIELLRASLLIAHNVGDLDRVIDMWHLPDDDPLKRIVYKAGHERPERWGGWLVLAGQLNKAHMADENPRHFALRAARCLRRHVE